MLREHLRAESFRLPPALMARSPAAAAVYLLSAHLWLAALVLAPLGQVGAWIVRL